MLLQTHTTKVLLVDDVPLVLESFRHLLDPHFTIVGAVQDSAEIMPRALEYRPDVILLDACMPGLSGFAATKQLKKLLPTVQVILVTMLTDSIFIREAFRAGASGYVLKESASEELCGAIDSVLANKRFLSMKIDPEVREVVEHEWFRPEGNSSDLTDRQREILVLLSQGSTTRCIAQQLNIWIKTVEFHKASITRKLGVHTTSDLIALNLCGAEKAQETRAADGGWLAQNLREVMEVHERICRERFALDSALVDSRSCISGHRPSIREYVQASEALLETDEFSDAEMEMVQAMLYRIFEKLLNLGKDGQP